MANDKDPARFVIVDGKEVDLLALKTFGKEKYPYPQWEDGGVAKQVKLRPGEVAGQVSQPSSIRGATVLDTLSFWIYSGALEYLRGYLDERHWEHLNKLYIYPYLLVKDQYVVTETALTEDQTKATGCDPSRCKVLEREPCSKGWYFTGGVLSGE
jgi:hypothetical protein